MVQVINTGNPQGKLAETLGMSLGQGLGQGLNTFYANKAIDNVLNDPSLKDAPLSQKWQRLGSDLAKYGETGQQLLQSRLQAEMYGEQEKQTKLQKKEGLEKEARLFEHQKSLQSQKDTEANKRFNPQLTPEQQLEKENRLFNHQKDLQTQKDAASLERTQNKPLSPGARSAQPVAKEINEKIGKVLGMSKGMSADELKYAFDEELIPPADSNQYIENRRRTEETGIKNEAEHQKSLRTETLPLRTEIAKKALAAKHGIQNKEQLLDLIDKGDIDDPTYATLAESLPLNLGKRLLSEDTVKYKAGLVEEFGDLKNLFAGATRVKELDILQEKIADLYLTDEQKKAILKSRIGALQSDVIMGDAAAELEEEGKNYPISTYQKKLQEKAQPKLDALFNRILDEQKFIIQDAENKKQMPLNINDPEDKQVIQQIFQEAGGNVKKAEELAKKKGYHW